MCVHGRYWYTMVLWLILVDQTEPAVEPYKAVGQVGELSREDFEAALRQVDSRMSSHPATAQVASQQGAYLAKVLNAGAASEPFKYRHMGSFAMLGGGKAAIQLPGDVVSMGLSTMLMWQSVYFSEQVSWRNRWLVLFDWSRRLFFGRDNSRI